MKKINWHVPQGLFSRTITIYRRLQFGRDDHLNQSEAYDISKLVREYGPRMGDTISGQSASIIYTARLLVSPAGVRGWLTRPDQTSVELIVFLQFDLQRSSYSFTVVCNSSTTTVTDDVLYYVIGRQNTLT